MQIKIFIALLAILETGFVIWLLLIDKKLLEKSPNFYWWDVYGYTQGLMFLILAISLILANTSMIKISRIKMKNDKKLIAMTLVFTITYALRALELLTTTFIIDVTKK